jgi:hypothetical protein
MIKNRAILIKKNSYMFPMLWFYVKNTFENIKIAIV